MTRLKFLYLLTDEFVDRPIIGLGKFRHKIHIVSKHLIAKPRIAATCR